MFIFDRCCRSSAAVTPVKYECDTNNLTGTSARSKILLTEKLANGALVTPPLIFTRSFGTLQSTRSLGRVGSRFNWPSEDQCQRSHSKCFFVFIPHLECKYSHLILSKLSRKSAIYRRRSPWLCIVLVCSLRSARFWSRAWPTLSWLAKLVGVSVSSSVRNKNYPHTLKLWNSRACVGNGTNAQRAMLP